MLIFVYSIMLLAVAIGGKASQTSVEYYFENDFHYDLPLIFMNYLGIIALWCRMKKHSCGPYWFWKLYTVGIILSTFLVPFFGDTFQNTMSEFGTGESLISFGFTVLLFMPYYLGLIDFAFLHRFSNNR